MINSKWIKTLIDVWSGSWVIPISIRLNTDLKEIYALDISQKALDVVDVNSSHYDLNIKSLKSDLLEVFFETKQLISNSILITANLPYIKKVDFFSLGEDVKDEPYMALIWWEKTWFELYEKFFKQVLIFFNNHWLDELYILCEIWHDQEQIARNFLDNLWIEHELFPDLRKINRFIKARIIKNFFLL
jgi:release factor glutamine methyltransferase